MRRNWTRDHIKLPTFTTPPELTLGVVQTGVALQIDVQNAATTDNIAAVTGTNENYVFTYTYEQEVTPGSFSVISTLTISGLTVAKRQVGIAATTTHTFTGATVDFPALTDYTCPRVTHVCVEVQAGTGASFVDAVTTDNKFCQTTQRMCKPDPTWKAPAPSNPSWVGLTSIPQGSSTTVTFDAIILNTAPTGLGNDILAATLGDKNYAFELYFASDSSGSSSLTSNFAATVSTNDQAALPADSGTTSVTIRASATVTLPTANCPQADYLCGRIKPGTGPKWVDNVLTNNVSCSTVVSVKGCNPDPIVNSFTAPTDTFVRSVNVPTSGFDVILQNIAPGGNSIITAASAGNVNFNITLTLTDVDLSTGATATVSVVSTTTINKADALGSANALLPASGNFAGTSSITMPDSVDCNKIKFICARTQEGTGATYTDVNSNNNYKCSNIVAQKTCFPDVEITSLSALGPVTGGEKLNDRAAINYKFTVNLQNVGATTADYGNNILAATGGNSNYEVKWYISDADIRPGGGANTLGIAQSGVVTYATPAQTQAAMAAGATTSIVDVQINYMIPQAKCPNAAYLCAYVQAHSTAKYIETPLTNNLYCSSILADKNCAPIFTNLNGAVSIPENTTSGSDIFNATATDGNGDTLTYSIQAGVGPFTINTATGDISLTGTINFEVDPTTYSLGVYVTDGVYSVTDKVLTITITDSNDPPVASNLAPNVANAAATVTFAEDYTGQVFDAAHTDEDLPAQTITYSIQSVSSGGTNVASSPFLMDGANGQITVVSPFLNFEVHSVYEVIVRVTDDGSPIKSGSGTLTVSVTNVQEPPVFTKLPTTVNISESVTAASNFFTLAAVDPENDTVSYMLSASPLDGKFSLVGNVLKYNANPNFNTEFTSTYTLSILAYDGNVPGTVGTLTVFIDNVPEAPRFTNLPGTAPLDENRVDTSQFFTVNAVDDENETINYTITAVYPPEGSSMFQINSATGVITQLANVALNHEAYFNTYKQAIMACDPVSCTTANLTVSVSDINEAPYFSYPIHTIRIKETQTSSYTIVPLDVDAGATHTCTKYPSIYSNLFTLTNCVVGIGPVDIDKAGGKPSTFYLDVKVTDNGGLFATFSIIAEILNVNDETPAFTLGPNPSATVAENASPGSTVFSFTVTDADLPPFDTFSVTVDPSTSAWNYFQASMISSSIGIVTVKSPPDRESISTISIKVLAVDSDNIWAPPTVNTGQITHTVTITNINDNIPVMGQNLYNWEISSIATIGKLLGTLTASDADVEFNSVSFHLLYSSSEFIVEASSGNVNSLVTPLLDWHEYVLYVTAKDAGPAPIFYSSLVSTIRIDTYIESDSLSSWYTDQPPTYWTTANIQSFLTAASSVCGTCIARLHNVTGTADGKSKLQLYFLKDDTSNNLGNIGKQKEFLNVDSFLDLYTVNGTPVADIRTNPLFAAFPVTKIERTVPAPVVPYDFWHDNAGAHIVMGMGISSSLALFLGILAWAAYKCHPNPTASRMSLDDALVTRGHDQNKIKTSNVTKDIEETALQVEQNRTPTPRRSRAARSTALNITRRPSTPKGPSREASKTSSSDVNINLKHGNNDTGYIPMDNW
ncbi:uncharacterized protein LOC141914919 [Tubulanus polymorphus]|uniref:uncharacterized protein LOC141914919 n=1 Tax=Tubulanus polymorphus TaxID=672921 RepID=UPI003DA32BA0